MVVVPARMHHPNFLPVVGGCHFRRERKARLFRHGQSVHIGSKCNHGPRPTSTEHPDDAGVSHFGLHLYAQGPQVFRYQRGRPELTVA